MRDPWGISGPTFIWIYAAAVVLPMIVSIVWGRRQARAVNAPAYGFQYTQLPSPYHLAYLAGSGDRAVEAAVAGLVEGEQLRVDSRGVLSPTGTPVRDPLEQQVMSAVIAKPGAARAAMVKSDLKKSSVVKELRGYLER